MVSRQTPTSGIRYNVTLLTEDDTYLFNEGTHYRIYDKLGAHPLQEGGEKGTYFATWAPNAERVSVMGDFNGWNKETHPLQLRGQSGVWEGFIPGVYPGAVYKYHVMSRLGSYCVDKADPYAFFAEVPPNTGSRVWDLRYRWSDAEWMRSRASRSLLSSPISIYEVHLGSWRRVPEEGHRPLTYRELAPKLAAYCQEMGFTHVELMPVTEHPLYASWGYQCTGYFAATSRYGTPQDLMYFVDHLHQQGIGVILDWVPAHFPQDAHGLSFFDGTHLYEHDDPRLGWHPDWGSFVFNYGRHEVQSFLLSSALFWLDKYHADGLRVDGVASMLYRDYSRQDGEWIPNHHGGRENLEAVRFLSNLNRVIYGNYPDVFTVAEESTAWPLVTRPTDVGGLGFGMKWDMGWMHDTLKYLAQDPLWRSGHRDLLTFRSLYAFSENFVLSLSHDEVVHMKGSLAGKMPGDDWQKLANLRLLFGWMWAQPGKKLLFMGGEFGQWREWSHDESLDWHLLREPAHAGVQRWVADLNRLYRADPALHELDCDPGGFEWIDCQDRQQSVISFLRKGRLANDLLLGVFNFTPVPRYNYRLGAPRGGFWRELLNSDAKDYGGSGLGNLGGVYADAIPMHDRPCSLSLTLPPLAAVFLKPEIKS